MWQAEWKIKSLHGSTDITKWGGGREQLEHCCVISWERTGRGVDCQHCAQAHRNHGVRLCLFYWHLVGVWWALLKSFSVLDHPFLGLLARRERLLVEITFPVLFGHSRLAISTVPYLGYVGDNKKTRGSLACWPSSPETPLGNPPSLPLSSESSYTCLLCYAPRL